MTEPTWPLKGIKVFDLTRVLAGPTCVQMLADLGADVIKIEKPGSGDDTRGFAPPFMRGTKESAYFVGVNRNKRSVTLDIAKGGPRARLALIAVFLACFCEWSRYLSPGERGTIMVLAADRRQARTIYRYATRCEGLAAAPS
jgi:CoA-transferase family III